MKVGFVGQKKISKERKKRKWRHDFQKKDGAMSHQNLITTKRVDNLQDAVQSPEKTLGIDKEGNCEVGTGRKDREKKRVTKKQFGNLLAFL